MRSDFQVYEQVIHGGTKKALKSTTQTLSSGILGGAYIALGTIGYLTAVVNIEAPGMGKFIGALLFPVGLLLIILTGAELFTGNHLMTLSGSHGKTSWGNILMNWLKIFIANAIGALLIAGLVHMSGYDTGHFYDVLEKTVHAKVGLSFAAALGRGILCNILVAIAVWISYSSENAGGKEILIWMPIALFVYSGYEHSVANMLYFSLAGLAGIDFTFAQMMNNLIPVSLGNIIGGGVVLPVLYYGVFNHKFSVDQ